MNKPAEYYASVQSASFSSSMNGSSEDTRIPEEKSERRHAAGIGILLGAVLIAGVVVPIVLTRGNN